MIQGPDTQLAPPFILVRQSCLDEGYWAAMLGVRASIEYPRELDNAEDGVETELLWGVVSRDSGILYCVSCDSMPKHVLPSLSRVVLIGHAFGGGFGD